MTLKKYLNALAFIDPDGRIGDFIYSLTYLEARALQDLMMTIDDDFYGARVSVLKKIKGIHTKSAIYQYFNHTIEDLHIKVEIANANESLDHRINVPFVGIKVSFNYLGLETPINVIINSSDKDARGFVDEKDWAEFYEVFMETLKRYIKVAKKGAPKFQYKKTKKKIRNDDDYYDTLDSKSSKKGNTDIRDILNNQELNASIKEKMKRNVPAPDHNIITYTNAKTNTVYTKTTADFYSDNTFEDSNYDDYYEEEYDLEFRHNTENENIITENIDMPEDVVENLKSAVIEETKSEESTSETTTEKNENKEESSKEETTNTDIVLDSGMKMEGEATITEDSEKIEEEKTEEPATTNPNLIIKKGKKRRS